MNDHNTFVTVHALYALIKATVIGAFLLTSHGGMARVMPATGNDVIQQGESCLLQDAGGNGDYGNDWNGGVFFRSGPDANVDLVGEYDLQADYDFIRIYSGVGVLLAEYTGSGSLNWSSAPGQEFSLHFVSDASNVTSGFQISASYNGYAHQAMPSEHGCGARVRLFDTGYTSNYGDNVNATSVFYAGGSAQISLTGTYDLEQYHDFLRVHEGIGTGGTLLWVYTGTGNAALTGAPGQSLTLVLTSNNSVQWAGFDLIVQTSDGNCSGATQIPGNGSNEVPCGTNVTLIDHAGQDHYDNNVDGYTILQNAGLGVLRLEGAYMTEGAYDDVLIYSGAGTGGALLGTYSGIGTFVHESAPGEILTVRFSANMSNTAPGFEINVNHSGSCSQVGIEEARLEKAIACYPNPSNGLFRVDLSDARLSSGTRLTITDALGRAVHTSNVTRALLDMDLGHLLEGVYMLHVNDPQWDAITQIMIQH